MEFTRTDFNTQALSQGTVQIALSQVLDPVRVIQGGGKLVFLMENNGGEFVLITKREIKDCKELDGKKFAIHGDTATTSLAAKLWLLNECKINPSDHRPRRRESDHRVAEQSNRWDFGSNGGLAKSRCSGAR